MPRRRILIFTPSVPYPPNWGFAIRVFNIVKYLALQNDVTVLTFAREDDADNLRILQEQTGANVVSVPFKYGTGPQRRAQAFSLFQPQSFSTQSLTSAKMQETLTHLIRQNDFDLMQVESSQLGGYDFSGGGVLILDEHNIEYELLYRMCKTEKSVDRRVYGWVEYLKLKREEQQFWSRADGCVMTSERETFIVRKIMPGKSITTAPNGVDTDFYLPTDTPTDPNSIVFTGLMRYRPNIDAALYFAEEIFPLILAKRPETVFSVVGMGPPDTVERLVSENIIVTGAVPDIRPYVDKAAVCVIPLRMGSGTRLKVLEALSMGKAMVSTSVGCEGIDVKTNEHLFIEDDPTQFANAVITLLEDAELRNRLGAAGRKLAVEKYGWESVVRDLEAYHESLLTTRRG